MAEPRTGLSDCAYIGRQHETTTNGFRPAYGVGAGAPESFATLRKRVRYCRTLSSSSGRTGLTKWKWKPAREASSRSASLPYPVSATRRV